MNKLMAMAAIAGLTGCPPVYYEVTVTTKTNGRVVVERAAPCDVDVITRAVHAVRCLNAQGHVVTVWESPTRVVLERMDTIDGVVVETVADVEMVVDAAGEAVVEAEPSAMTRDRPETAGEQ